MFSSLSVTNRRREPEIMDQPDLDERLHRHALTALERINALSGSARILWKGLRPLLKQQPGPLTLLDVATGAGDVPIRLCRRVTRAGHSLRLFGCDRSSTALSHAREKAARQNVDATFFEWDVLAQPPPDQYDVVTCSLFLHHLDREEAIRLLGFLAQATRRLLLINDLKRSTWGLIMAIVGTRLLTRSHVVRVDGPLSVRAAFTCAEALELAAEAQLTGAQVCSCWPSRWLLSWFRSSPLQ